MRNVYINLSEKEKDFKNGCLINEANSGEEEEFQFISFQKEKKNENYYALCKAKSGIERCFFPECIKVSWQSIEKIEKEEKLQKKILRASLKKEIEEKKEIKRKEKELKNSLKKKEKKKRK